MSSVIWTCTIFSAIFQEEFNTLESWTHSMWKNDESSTFILDKGEFHDKENQNSLMTNNSARFYTISQSFPTFENKENSVFFQYTVKNAQNIDCGGMYVKLYPPLSDLSSVKGGVEETPYNIMFGPDKCGGTSKVHFIFNFNKSNIEKSTYVPMPTDELSHLYTFGLMHKGSYFVSVDGSIKAQGNIHSDWKFLKDVQIADPTDTKPPDWIDDEMMPDETDVKPEGWDDIPEEISDPDATKPDDWDTEDDGEWEPPLIKNPEYKGLWMPKKIKNPNYIGQWSARLIANPEYEYSDSAGNYTFGAIGFEIWQVKAGTVFDSILLTQEVEELYEHGNKTMESIAREKSVYEQKKEEKEKETAASVKDEEEVALKDEV